MGVLQRIGLAYMFGALLAQGRTVKQQVVTIVVLLYGYWFAMTAAARPRLAAPWASSCSVARRSTMAAWWDRLLLDWTRFGLGNHTWVSSVTWDPEGHLLDDSGDWYGDARQPRGSVDRHQAAAHGAPQRTLRRRRARDDGRIDVELVVPDQQESVDELVRSLLRRHGRRRDRDDHVGRRRTSVSSVGRSRSSSTE